MYKPSSKEHKKEKAKKESEKHKEAKQVKEAKPDAEETPDISGEFKVIFLRAVIPLISKYICITFRSVFGALLKVKIFVTAHGL